MRWATVGLWILSSCASESGSDGTFGSEGDAEEASGGTQSGSGEAGASAGDSMDDTAADEATGDDGDATGEPPKWDLAPFPDFGGGGEDGGEVDESTCEAAAMSLTSAGCLFAPFVGNPGGGLPWAVIAANTNPNAANVTLYDPNGGVLQTVSVPPQQLHIFEYSAQASSWELPSATNVYQSALRLESDVPIVAYQFQPYSSSQNATADATLLLPEHAWADNYLSVAAMNDGAHWVTVISLDDGVEVQVTASANQPGTASGGGGIPGLAPGQSHTEILDSQQAMKIYATSTDLSGMRVYSPNGRVAVFAGSPGQSLPGPGFQSFQDRLEEQLPPRAAWGTEYAAIKFQPRNQEEDLYKIVADKDNTVVNLTGGYTNTFNLNEGESVQFQTAENFLATGNEAFLVAHHIVSCSNSSGPIDHSVYPGGYVATNNCSSSDDYGDMADPAIAFLTPTDQYRSRYTFLSPFTYAWDMVTVVAPSGGWNSISLDGAALPAPTPVGFNNLSYARILIDDGPHFIESPTTPFGLEAYGYDCRISYAYAGGLSLGSINVPPVPQGYVDHPDFD